MKECDILGVETYSDTSYIVSRWSGPASSRNMYATADVHLFCACVSSIKILTIGFSFALSLAVHYLLHKAELYHTVGVSVLLTVCWQLHILTFPELEQCQNVWLGYEPIKVAVPMTL